MLNSDPLYKTMQARKNQEKELIIANESLESETTKQMHELSGNQENIYTSWTFKRESIWDDSALKHKSYRIKKKSKYHAKSHSVFWYSYLLIFIASFTMRTLIMDVDFCLHSAIIVCADIYFNPLKIGASKIKKKGNQRYI